MQRNHVEMRDLLLQVLGDRVEMAHIVALQNSGEHVAERLMRDGQEVLPEALLTSHIY